jgi:hypothetical protein
MQAQATSGGAGGSALQNPKVQIAVIAVGVIALIVVIWMLFFNRPSDAGYTPVATAGALGGNGPTAMAGMPGAPADSGMAAPGAPGGFGAPGAMGMAPAAASQPAEASTKPQSPGVRSRSNPFRPNKDLQEVIDSVPTIDLPPTLAAPHNLFAELYTPKPPEGVSEDEGEGPPVPPMRVAGIIHGNDQLTAMIQMGDVFMTVTPGNMIPEGNPVYRVERIEQDKVFLSRRWELGDRKGVQRIEVALANGQRGQAPVGSVPGFPGGGANGPSDPAALGVR